MTDTIVAKKLQKVGPEGDVCFLQFASEDGQTAELRFPIEQVDALIGMLCQVQQDYVGRTQPGKKYGLLTTGGAVSYSQQAQQLYIELRVGPMVFPFILPRNVATGLSTEIRKHLPTH